MKLRNKKTGKIIDGYIRENGDFHVAVFNKVYTGSLDQCSKWYSSLAKLNAEWEDYEEPKEHWCINEFGTTEMAGRFNRENIYDKARKHIGNDFKTKEEAVKAAEKLKAWKRLKDKGFRFTGIMNEYVNAGTPYYPEPLRIARNIGFNKSEDSEWIKDNRADLDLLFGGEE